MPRAAIDVAPRWQILPFEGEARPGALAIRLAAGPGFGDGTHPTTQLCLQAIAALAPRGRAWRMLDFGSGSGILSIAGALVGADVDAVEIDAAARQHAARNVAANAVDDHVRPSSALADAAAVFDVVIANITRDVLLAHAEPLVAACARGGHLVLSGLVSTDVPEVSARYAPRLGDARPEVYEREEWRALLWRGRAGAARI